MFRMDNNRHIRITRVWADVSLQMVMADYFHKSDRVLVFQHTPDSGASREHVHIFCFDLSTKPDTIRETLRKYIPSKMDLCVKTRAGKKNDIEITDQGAYDYASRYGQIKPVWTKGYTDDELTKLYDASLLKAAEIKTKREENVVYAIREVVKVDQVYNRLIEESTLYIPAETRKAMTLQDWKRWVVMNYFKAGKPAPRTADGNRYAYSLMMTSKYDFSNPESYPPLTALTTDYNA